MLHFQHFQNEVLLGKIMQAVACRPTELGGGTTTNTLIGNNEDNKATELMPPWPYHWDRQNWYTTSSWLQYILGSLRYEVRKQIQNGKEGRNIIAKVKVPRWISNMVWECRGNEVAIGWRFIFQTYRIVPTNSPLFEFARQGNVKGIQELFSSHEALVNDRNDYSEETALHVSQPYYCTSAVVLRRVVESSRIWPA